MPTSVCPTISTIAVGTDKVKPHARVRIAARLEVQRAWLIAAFARLPLSMWKRWVRCHVLIHCRQLTAGVRARECEPRHAPCTTPVCVLW